MKAFPRRAGQPAVEPITLAEALTHLREEADSGANDAYITSLIKVARQACEDRTERSLIATPWTLQLDAFADAIELRQPPVIAVTSVSYLDTEGAPQTVLLADTYLDNASEPAWLVPAPGKSWPATYDRVNAVTVAFTAGYGATAADVPLPLRQWILLAVGTMYETRNADSERPQVRHAFADHLLDPYRLLGV